MTSPTHEEFGVEVLVDPGYFGLVCGWSPCCTGIFSKDALQISSDRTLRRRSQRNSKTENVCRVRWFGIRWRESPKKIGPGWCPV